MRHLIMAAAAVLALGSTAFAAEVKIGTEGAYPPFNFVDDDGNVGGFDIEVGNEICKRAALECTWVVNEWDSIIPNLLAGNYDAIMADMTITDERRQTIDFSTPYFPPDPSGYVSLAGRTFDYGNLTGLRVGAQTATIQSSYIESTLKDANTILTYETLDQELADLHAGNIDLVFLDGSVIGETVAGSNGALKADGPAVLIGDGVGIGIRKADTDLRDKINAALSTMKDDGTLDELIVQFFPEQKGGPFYKL